MVHKRRIWKQMKYNRLCCWLKIFLMRILGQ